MALPWCSQPGISAKAAVSSSSLSRLLSSPMITKTPRPSVLGLGAIMRLAGDARSGGGFGRRRGRQDAGHFAGEHVAAVADRLQQRAIATGHVELLAQARDVHVEGLGILVDVVG